MADGCLCYTTDLGYALPTVLSAAQARVHLAARTDVVIILVGAPEEAAKALAPACAASGIVLQAVPRQAIDGLPIQFARHCLDRLLDPAYRRVAHVDGDTHVCGDLDPLLDATPGPGRVIAVVDPMALMLTHQGRTWRDRRAYFAGIGLGIEAASRYVNTGIFRIDRAELGPMGDACRHLALREGARFAFGEQDAFNVALGPSIDLASFRWNYPAFFANFGFGHLVEPRVRHFMSNPRPWQGPFPPWGQDGFRPYLDLVARHPELARFHAPLRGLTRLRYALQQRMKRHREPPQWDRTETRSRIRDLEAAAVV